VFYNAQACTELTLSNKIQRHFPLLATQTYCGVLQDNAKSVQLAISIQQRLPQLTASSQLQKQLSLASFSLIVYTGPDRLNIPGEPEHEALKVRSRFLQLFPVSQQLCLFTELACCCHVAALLLYESKQLLCCPILY